MQAGGQREVAEVVGGELHLPALGRAGQRGGHHAGVVDEDVQRPVPARREPAMEARSARSSGATRTFLDLAAKEAIWSARYSSTHLAAVNLRTQMVEMRRSITDELGRIAESYKSDYEIAKSRVDGAERSLQGLVTTAQSTNRDRLGLEISRVRLRSTIRCTTTSCSDTWKQFSNSPITEARVISPAAPPDLKSGPVAWLVLGIAVLFGTAAGFGVATIREAIDRVFRTVRQVETDLQASCLAVLPKLTDLNVGKKEKNEPGKRQKGGAGTKPVSAVDSAAVARRD